MNAQDVKRLHDLIAERNAPGYVLDALVRWMKELEAAAPGESTKTSDSVRMKMVSAKKEVSVNG
jgi:hypothetical protein